MRGFARLGSFDAAPRDDLMSPPLWASGPRMPALTEVSSALASTLFQAPPDLADGQITDPAYHNYTECQNR